MKSSKRFLVTSLSPTQSERGSGGGQQGVLRLGLRRVPGYALASAARMHPSRGSGSGAKSVLGVGVRRGLGLALASAALLLALGCSGEPAPQEDAPAASTQAAKRPKKAPRGDPMEPFELPMISGGRYSSGEILGKRAAVIYFFATWYAGAADDFKALSETLKGRDVALIAVAVDSAESAAKVDAFVKENAVTAPVLLDPDGKLFEVRYTGIKTAPATLVVSAKGELIAKRGPEEDEKEPLGKLLDKLKPGEGE